MTNLSYHPARARLRILATTDLHMHLTGFDYLSDCRALNRGLTRVATLVKDARKEADDMGASILLFDNGDSLQGSPLGDFCAQAQDLPNPLMQAFAQMGYDAIGLGNHDFNFGLAPLGRALSAAPCPAVCSNVTFLSGLTGPLPAKHLVLERQLTLGGKGTPIRIGVFSILPPQTAVWDAHHLQGHVEIDDILNSAQDQTKLLRESGCDIVIALAHSGLGSEAPEPGLENAVIPLAGLAGIDAIVAGHTHLTLPGPAHDGLPHVDADRGLVHGRPTVMPGSAGSHLGVIDMALAPGPEGQWRIVETQAELRPVFDRGKVIPEDPELAAILKPVHMATRQSLKTAVGHTPKPLHSFFSFLKPDDALAKVACAQASFVRQTLEGTAFGDLPLLSATAPCKTGGRSGPDHYTDVHAGSLTLRHLMDLHVFPNEVRALKLTGRQLHAWLTHISSLFNTIKPGEPALSLTAPGYPGHDFDTIFGLTYEFDLSQPSRAEPSSALDAQSSRRLRNLCWNGRPVDPDQQFVVALNSYRAAGGGNIAALAGADTISIPRTSVLDALRDYAGGLLPLDPLENAERPWRFTSLANSRAILRTGPGALSHMEELGDYLIANEGQDEDGFLNLLIAL